MSLFNTLLIFSFTLCFGATTLSAQNVNIPDANFKAYLVGNTAINTNADTEIQVSEATIFAGAINCAGLSIADLTGIEAFLNLTSLQCNVNQLTSLDVTQNTSLTRLICYSNQISSLDVTQNTSLTLISCASNGLTGLDVTQNTSLTHLYCNTNPLNSLDVTQNTSLTHLYCYRNQLSSLDVTQNTGLTLLHCNINTLSSLDVTQNTSLTVLHCYSNQISSLDVTQNTSLTHLYCFSNQISSLDVTQNTSLIELNCNVNPISSLDVTQNISLTELHCHTNQLSSLDVTQNTSLTALNCKTNQLSSLDVTQNISLIELNCKTNQLSSLDVKNGNNTNFVDFNAIENPNLTCIQADDSTYSTINWTNVDTIASFSTNCSVFSNTNTINKEVNLTAYPNPTTKKITLNFGKLYQEANIQVTNLTGQTVLTKTVQNNSKATLEIEGAAGVYFVNIQTEEGMAMLKIIKE